MTATNVAEILGPNRPCGFLTEMPGRELSGTGMKSLEEQLADAHRMIGILHGALFSLPCCVQDMITDADDLAFYREYCGYDEDDSEDATDED